MGTDGCGWIVLQRRMDESWDFFLDWKNYDLGFGPLEEEFWLGLNTIHCLTPSNVSLRVDLEDFDGNTRFAEYEQGKFSLYNRCFYDVNGMVYTTFTIVNIPLILYHVFFTLCIFDGFITTVVLRVFLM